MPNYLGSQARLNNDVEYSRLGNFVEFPVDPGGDSPCCSFEKCMINKSNELNASRFQFDKLYSVVGPNSNSFAHRLILECGGRLGVPMSDVGQSGAYGIESPWNVPLP